MKFLALSLVASAGAFTLPNLYHAPITTKSALNAYKVAVVGTCRGRAIYDVARLDLL